MIRENMSMGMMADEDKYEPPTELIGVTNTVTCTSKINGQDERPDADVTDVNDKYPDEDERGSDTDQDINPVAEDCKYNFGRKIRSTATGTDSDDGEVIDSSSLTDEESEWTAENESSILSDEHVERDTTTVTQQSVKRKDVNNKRKRRNMSKIGRNVKQLESYVKQIRKELEGIMKRIVRQELYNAVSRLISQIPTTDRKIVNYTKDQKTSWGIKKKGNEEISKNEISNWNISDIFRSNSSDAASVIANCLLEFDKITYPIKMFIQSRDSLSRLEYVRLLQFDTDIEREDPKYPHLAIDTSPIQTSFVNTMVNSQLDTSDFDDEDVGQQRSYGLPLIARTQNINMKSMICVHVVQYQRGVFVLAVFRGSPRGIQQINVILITCEMIYFLLNNNRLSSVFNISRAIPNVVKCFIRWLCVNDISFNFQHLAQLYKSSLKMSPESSWHRTGSCDFTFERQVQPSVDMIPIVRNVMEPPSFKQIDHNCMEPQDRTNGVSNLITKPLTSSVTSVKKPDMNLSAAGGVLKKSGTKDRKHRMNSVKRKTGRSPSDGSNTYMRKGIMGEYCVTSSQRKGKHYQKGTPDLDKGFFNGHRNRLSRNQSVYTENYRKVTYESEYCCEFGFTDSNINRCSYNSVANEDEEVESYESHTSESGTGVISDGVEERGDITDIHNPSSTGIQGRLLNIHPTEYSCETEMCTSVTHNPAYQRRNHVPFKTTRSLPPEGGTIGNVVLSNTCSIDGFLLMFYLELDSDPDRRNQFEDSDNRLEKIFFKVWDFFKKNNFAMGKLIWYMNGRSVSLEDMSSGTQIKVDITGTEDERIFSVLDINQDCPDAVMMQTEQYVLPIYNNGELLSDAITKGFRNVFGRDMDNCTNRERDGEKCTGTRRQSFVDLPFIVPVNFFFLQFDGETNHSSDIHSSDIPEKMEHNDLIYDLRLVRFYRDNHFVDKIKVDDVWTYYDNSHEQLYYFDDDLARAKLSSCYYIKRRQNR